MNNSEGKNMLGDNRVTNDRSAIGAFRNATRAVKILACVVIAAFGGLVTAPAVAAIRKEIEIHPWHFRHQDPAAELSSVLEKLHNELPRMISTPTRPAAGAVSKALGTNAVVPASARSRLGQYLDKLERVDRKVDLQFSRTKKHLKRNHLSSVIIKRELKIEKEFHKRAAAFINPLKAAYHASNGAGFRSQITLAMHQLDKRMVKRPREKFDPHNLPFAVAKNRHIKPRLTQKAYQLRPVSGPKVNLKTRSISSLSTKTSSTTTSSNPDDPSYLASTVDVQITDAIKAKATALDHDPVKIFNWVHNNIEYIPTYGSIQGSAQTLATKRGNSFDTASLLIALLRASNIPARYVYGTVRAPIGEVENWVGGVTSPNSALNLMEQGGIPVTGLAQGGQIKYVRMEHVWVEASVNYIPSRASKPGPGNTWVPMDASFKQYTYKPGMNLKNAVPFDADAFAQHILDTTTIDQQAGYFQGMDAAYVEQQTQNYDTALKNYLSTSAQNATIGDVIGSRTINPCSQNFLAASLPYAVGAVGSRMASLSSNLRWEFTIRLADASGNTVAEITSPTPTLAGKTITLFWHFMSKDDAEAWFDSMPTAPSGGYTLSGLNKMSFPGYLIHLQPQVAIDGKTLATGTGSAMGAQLTITEGYTSPVYGQRFRSKKVTVGEDESIGLDLQGISQAHLLALQKEASNAYGYIQSSAYGSLNAFNVSGTLFGAGIISYFRTVDFAAKIGSKSGGLVQYLAPSYGTFKATEKTDYLYGIPRKISFTGMTMDINLVHSLMVSKNNSAQVFKAYNMMYGTIISSFENEVPEQLLKNPQESLNGISAVKALALANLSDQRIYQITSNNIVATLPQLTVSQNVITNIEDAVNSGDQVIVSQDPITNGGWTGAGYIVLDPGTGSAAYRIRGGANGGYIKTGIGALGTIDQQTLNAISRYGQEGKWSGVLSGLSNTTKKILPSIVGFTGFMGDALTVTQLFEACGFSVAAMVMSLVNIGATLLIPLAFTGVGFLIDLFMAVVFSLAISMFNYFVEITCEGGDV